MKGTTAGTVVWCLPIPPGDDVSVFFTIMPIRAPRIIFIFFFYQLPIVYGKILANPLARQSNALRYQFTVLPRKDQERKMKKLFLLSGLTLAIFGGQAQAVPVDIELALLVDVSGSVDATEYGLQKTGYVDAFKDPAIQAQIAGLTNGIAVTYIEWSGSAEQSTQVGWTQLTDAASADSFASDIAGTTRAFDGLTAPGSAINFATPLFTSNSFEGDRWVIDVSGDGQENTGDDTSDARDAFLASLTSGLTGAINGLPIGDASLTTWYENNVQGGTNSFTVAATSFSDFGNAVKTKIGREINHNIPEPSALALLGLGLAGMGVARRRRKV